MFRHFRPIIIGVAIFSALLVVNPATSPINALNDKVCSGSIGFKYYGDAGLANSVRNSQIMAMGTIKNVETRVVDWYEPVSANGDGTYSSGEAIDFQHMGKKIPWKFVTLEVEKYYFDKSGKYSGQIVFRTPANQCVDKFGVLSSEKDARAGDSPEYHEGERAIIEITSIQLGELYFDNGYKLDINGDEIRANEKIGLKAPVSVEAFEAKIARQIESQNLG